MSNAVSPECMEVWRSVRKVRYREDILSSLRFVAENDGVAFVPDRYRKYLLEGRREKFTLIMKHFKSAIYTPTIELTQAGLRSTLPDTIAFLKNVGLLALDNGIIRSTPLCKNLYSQWTTDQARGEMAFLKTILDSKYPAYFCFLLTLSSRAPLEAGSHLAKRTRESSQFLKSEGFHTDVASFLAIRDLFYEFGVCNWAVDHQGKEVVFSTADLVRDTRESWLREIKLKNGLYLVLWRNISHERFGDRLREAYFKLSGDRFGVAVRLMDLRDLVCLELLICDQQFRHLLTEYIDSNGEQRISLSFGTVTIRKRSYGLKLPTLPMVSPNRIALFLEMEERNK